MPIDTFRASLYNQLMLRRKVLFLTGLILFFPVAIASAENFSPVSNATTPVDLPAEPVALKEKTVRAVEVKGNKSIGISTVLSKIKTRVGQEYLQSVISDDLKRLYNTGYFADVSVDREDYEDGFKVIFFVVEKSIVEEITFSKTKYFKPKHFLNKMKTKKGKFLDNKILNDDVRTIEELYSKKGLTSVEVSVEKEHDPLTNKTKLHFVIKEGVRIQIKRIVIDGNNHFPDKRILRVMKTRADSLFTSGYLQKETVEEDVERIKSFYEREGFIDVQAGYELEHTTESRLTLQINITEGKQFFVDKIVITGNTIVTETEIMNLMQETVVGGVFSRERLSVDLANIRTLYFDKGYIFADIKESTALNSESGKVEITLAVTEGELAYINRIKIQGNDHTRDIVIRRELRLFPGDRFDGAKLRRSKERLRNLGYFEDISYDIEDTDSTNTKDLLVQVKEAKTGSFSFGGGFSTVDQVVGFVEVQQKNFDFTNWPTFTGGGQNLTLRAETGSTRNNTRLSFTEPWLFDYPVSFGFDAYRSERDRERDIGYAYDESRAGGALRFGKEFTDFVSGDIAYRREKIGISDLESNVSADLLAEAGHSTVSSVSLALARDSRDSIFNPTKGLYVRGSLDGAGGILGGNKDFWRFSTRTTYDIPVKFPFKSPSVLEFGIRTGIVDAYGDSTKVPIFERFFAGGARTIRGYNERKVGPIDPVTLDPIGGESMIVGNIEYTIPIIDFLKMAAFFDSGNVWPDIEDFGSGDFKSGAGLGLRVKTPIGPVNLDYGFPLDDEPGETDREGQFYFSVSRGF